jgi:hypothetical protein
MGPRNGAKPPHLLLLHFCSTCRRLVSQHRAPSQRTQGVPPGVPSALICAPRPRNNIHTSHVMYYNHSHLLFFLSFTEKKYVLEYNVAILIVLSKSMKHHFKLDAAAACCRRLLRAASEPAGCRRSCRSTAARSRNCCSLSSGSPAPAPATGASAGLKANGCSNERLSCARAASRLRSRISARVCFGSVYLCAGQL